MGSSQVNNDRRRPHLPCVFLRVLFCYSFEFPVNSDVYRSFPKQLYGHLLQSERLFCGNSAGNSRQLVKRFIKQQDLLNQIVNSDIKAKWIICLIPEQRIVGRRNQNGGTRTWCKCTFVIGCWPSCWFLRWLSDCFGSWAFFPSCKASITMLSGICSRADSAGYDVNKPVWTRFYVWTRLNCEPSASSCCWPV